MDGDDDEEEAVYARQQKVREKEYELREKRKWEFP